MYEINFFENPVACPRPRVTRFGVYYPKKYMDHKEVFEEHLYDLKLNKLEKDKPLILDVTFYIEIPKSFSNKKKDQLDTKYVVKKPDVDNYLKTTMDAMSEIIYHDDNQIVEINCRKIYTKNQGYYKILIDYKD